MWTSYLVLILAVLRIVMILAIEHHQHAANSIDHPLHKLILGFCISLLADYIERAALGWPFDRMRVAMVLLAGGLLGETSIALWRRHVQGEENLDHASHPNSSAAPTADAAGSQSTAAKTKNPAVVTRT